MNTEELKQLISIYVDGEATPEQEGIVLYALKDSAELRAYYQDLVAISDSLLEWPDEHLSPDLEHMIQKNISKQEERKMKKKKWIPTMATVAVAILVVVVGQQYTRQAVQGRVKSAADDIGDQFLTQHSPKETSVSQLAVSQPELRRDAKVAQLVEEKSFRGNDAVRKQGNERVDSSILVRQKNAVAMGKSMPLGNQGANLHGEASRPEAQYLKRNPSVEVLTASVSGSSGMVDGTVAGFISNTGDAIAPAPPQIYPIDQSDKDFNTEQYDLIVENEFLNVANNPLSTFSIDVDTASYANLRRFLMNGQTPPVDAVRIEEMVNYFLYDYPQPQGDDPFSVNIEVAKCPWNNEHQLAMIGLQGKSLDASTVPDSNLVFLIDVSGSMNNMNKLPLLKQGFKMMVNQLRPEEKISIVTYAGSAGIVLDSVSGGDKQQILSAIDRLKSGGSTAGAQGILTAYELAKKNYIPGGNNRVILATDGDFNIGVSSDSELVRIIEEKRNDGIFLTVLGFGMGNYKDGKMEKIADKGNGNYYYIDTQREAKKVMVRELGSTLFTIAKDVKLQVEFNPQQVKAYRLLGYENRKLNKEDFNDDTRDAGELGAGHTVTAFYEIIPAGSNENIGTNVDPLKYQVPQAQPTGTYTDEIMTVKLRYKKPDENVSKLLSRTVTVAQVTDAPSQNCQWASAVAEFGLLLRNSRFKGEASFSDALQRAKAAKGSDEYGYRQEMIDMMEKAQDLVPEHFSTGYGFKGRK